MLGTAVFSSNPLLIAALGAAGLCAAALTAAVAVASRLGLSPGARALFHWAPIAVAVLVARGMGLPDVAIGIIFGTSVAVLSTAVGSLSTIAPVGPAPARWKRIWPFTLVAVLIVFVSGFNGLLTWRHGVALGLEGLVILQLWRDPTSEHEWGGSLGDPSRPFVPNDLAWIALVASLLLAAGGAWLSVHGAIGMTHLKAHASPGAIAASLLSLVLCSPMIQSGRGLATVGATWIPMTAQVGVVLLNLCLLLPIIALMPYAQSLFQAVQFHGRLTIDWSSYSPQATVFPLAVWRIDTVVLIVLSTLFLPVAVGKWNLGREEGMLLIAGYCFYLLAVTMAGM
jgi:cation:H+ antiporter